LLILPAIDLLQGQCVRLQKGELDTAKTYSDNPEEIAQRWQQAGARIIHVVNLDGAFGRDNKNIATVQNILNVLEIPIELGGGIRSLDDVSRLLDLGVRRVVLGTVAIEQPKIVENAIIKHSSDAIVVGIDARNGKVAIRGWEKQTQISLLELARQMKSRGVSRIIYTDVLRDGLLKGPNISSTIEFAKKSGLKTIGSGGFSKKKHFQMLNQAQVANIEGEIIGKALYENKIELKELINEFQN
jgi:phosphoribosylformimino-5-aminoimidazole carboxamide ribotide isomerase